MPDISITVTDKRPVCTAGTTVVCDNSDYIVHWDLDEEWNAYDTKTMRVIYMDSTYADTVFTGDSVALPPVPVPGCVQIGLYAGDIHTSRMALLRALSSVRSASGAPANPTPDVYDQLMERMAQLEATDWNQNDPTAKDYVKNRPFYTETVETVLVEESTVPFADTGEGFYTAHFPSNFEATVGETYKVYWDGTVYECTCVDLSGNTIIGNLSIAGAGSDTGEPFIMQVVNGKGIIIITADTSASHTFSISRLVHQVVKIDEKYLPDTVATKSEVEATQEVIDGVFSSVATFTFDKQTSGRDTFVFNAFHYYKISDFNPAPSDVISFKGTIETGKEYSEINIGNNCVQYGGVFIVVASAGGCSLPILGTTTTKRFTAPSAGLYAMYEVDDPYQTAKTGEFTLRASTGRLYITGLLLKSSTTGSAKKFGITVDDDYNVSATNTTDSVSKTLATTEYVDNSVSKPLTYDYMPEGYPKKSVLFDIEWDGDTSGIVSVAGAYYKAANYIAVTKADLVGCMVSLQNDPEHPKPFAVIAEDIIDTKIPHAIMVSDYVIFVSEPTSYGRYNFTEPGIYMAKVGEMYASRIVKQTITTIAEEFLPYTAKNTTTFHSDSGVLKHDDGTLVTAQEAYDAFMNTRVLIMWIDHIYQAISMLWYDNNSKQTDPTNVGYVQLAYVLDSVGTITLVTGEAGDSSLIPARA